MVSNGVRHCAAALVVAALLVAPAKAADDEDTQAVASTLLNGIQDRANRMATVCFECLHESFQQSPSAQPASVNSPQPEPGGSDRVEFRSTSGHGLYWVRAAAESDHARVEVVTLKPGPPFFSVVPGIGPHLGVPLPDGRSVDGDWVRSVTSWDGDRVIQWQNAVATTTVAPQRWAGVPADNEVIRDELMLGIGGRAFSDRLMPVLAKPGAITRVGSRATADGTEYTLQTGYQVDLGEQGTMANEYEIVVLPDRGYVVQRYEERNYNAVSGFGTGLVVVARDLQQAGNTWLPTEVASTSYTYREGAIQAERASRIRFTYATTDESIAAVALSGFLPLLGAWVADATGSFPPELTNPGRIEAALSCAEESDSTIWPDVSPHLNVPH